MFCMKFLDYIPSSKFLPAQHPSTLWNKMCCGVDEVQEVLGDGSDTGGAQSAMVTELQGRSSA